MNEANAKKSPNLLQRLLKRREMVTFVLLVVVLIVAMMLSDSFRDVGYLFKSATKTIELAMTALPMTFIIIAGMIDLSVPSAMCCSATMAAVAYSGGMDMGLAIVVGLLTGVILGCINGTLIAYAKLPAMIVTIGTMNLFRGLAQIFIGDASLGSFPGWFNAVDKMAVFETEDANFSVTLLLFIILAIIAYLLLHKMSIGRKVFAIGTNEQAAIWSGIKTKKIKLGLFIASGIIAAVGGLLTMSRLGLVRYDMNLNKEVDVIIMVLLGGADINGGSGSIVGTFLAVLLVIILKTGLIVANVTADAQMFVMGLILLISIIIPNVGQVLKERKDK